MRRRPRRDMRVTPVYAELEHARPQCARVEPEDIRSATRAFDPPSSVFQCLHYVLAFNLTERLGGERLLVDSDFKTIHQLQDASLCMDHSALDSVGQFFYVTR